MSIIQLPAVATNQGAVLRCESRTLPRFWARYDADDLDTLFDGRMGVLVRERYVGVIGYAVFWWESIK